MRHLVDERVLKSERSAALSYINQAFDFFEAARNPQIGSKPLLYYYSFLNLAKTTLLIRKVKFAVALMHGISDPRANQRTRLRLEGQTVIVQSMAHNHSQLFPEFARVLGGNTKPRTLHVVDLLAQIPSVHRTFVGITSHAPLFTPIKQVELTRDDTHVWAKIMLDKHDKDVSETLPELKRRRAFRRYFLQTVSSNEDEIWLETQPVAGRRRGVDPAIRRLASYFRDVGISSILTSRGYRFYFCNIEPRRMVSRLAASYAAFFYLGSITRYRPNDFDKVLEAGFSWVVNELLATEPVQFLYTLASELAGVDVVRPYATSM